MPWKSTAKDRRNIRATGESWSTWPRRCMDCGYRAVAEPARGATAHRRQAIQMECQLDPVVVLGAA
jgi:hypothetical protein